MPVYKNKRGKYFSKFNYKDFNGQIRQKKKEGFRTQKEAREFEIEFLNKVKTSSDMIFSNLYSRYMEYQKQRLKPTTLSNKEFLFKLKILPYFKDMPIDEIEPSTVMQWQNTLLEKGFSETYLKTIHNQLSAILNFAMKYYKLPSNAARVCGSMGKKHANSMQFYTIDEFNKFIISFEDKIVTRLIFTIMFYTGIRSGELLALTVRDIDLENNTMKINKNYARYERQDLILEPKTPKSNRIITIPDFLKVMLKDYLSLIKDLKEGERIFPFTKSFLNTEMQRGSDISGEKKIRVHDLRHSHASLLIEMGISPLLIAQRLGHEKIQTTLETYSHLYPNKQNEIALKLNSMQKKCINKAYIERT